MAATIEHLPPEILELIFQELSLKDINNCSQTCLWWSYCIEEFFKNKGKCNFLQVNIPIIYFDMAIVTFVKINNKFS